MAANTLTVHPTGGYDQVTVDRAGGQRTVSYRRDGILHRLDGPAVECSSGAQSWYLAGVLHRDGGPAVIAADGSQRWFTLGVERHADTLHPGIRTHAK